MLVPRIRRIAQFPNNAAKIPGAQSRDHSNVQNPSVRMAWGATSYPPPAKRLLPTAMIRIEPSFTTPIGKDQASFIRLKLERLGKAHDGARHTAE